MVTTVEAESEAEATNNGRNPVNSIITTPKWPSSRRTPSVSSSSSLYSISSSSFRSCSPPPSPTTPLRRFAAGGIPFSWETIPGIPKKHILNKIDSCRNHNYLPLPPAAAPVSAAAKPNHHKKHITSRRDPFFAALVECSKGGGDDGDDKAPFGSNFPRSGRILGDRFRFVNNMSCKSFSAVTESLVLLPKGPRRIDYDVAKKRSD